MVRQARPDRPRTGAWARLPRSDDHCARGLTSRPSGLGARAMWCSSTSRHLLERPETVVFQAPSHPRTARICSPTTRPASAPLCRWHLEHPCACHTAALVSLRRPAPAQISRLRGGAPGPLQVRSRCQNDGSGKSHQNASGKTLFKFITPHPARFRAVQPSGGPASRVEWIRAGKHSGQIRVD